MTAPLLFDLPSRPPTTRAIAAMVKARGLQAFDDAPERADHARYKEVTCRSALNRVEGMPFRWTLNPYRGCTHGCHYCFARRYQTQLELGPDDEFSSVILVKVNLVEVLRQELASPRWTRELVALGTATDPYQPIEGRYRLTRRALEALAAARTPVGLVTKGPMVVRDRDVLQELTRRAGCTVSVSVPTVDEAAWASLEPGTAHPLQRLRAVRELRRAGIDAGVLMAPIVPGITSHPRQLERTMQAIAESGAAFVGMNLLHLEGGTRDHFMRFLRQAYPQLVAGYERLYRGKYAPKSYAARVRALVEALKRKYAVGAGRSCAQVDPGPAGAAAGHWHQPALPW
ncbi:MAG TPA: radical SAM protein [Vicinamibacterales bacterium]|nr:radical SAM protein [Vicinamibacterales bacterium]